MINIGKTPEERNRLILVAMICFGIIIFIADIFFSLGFIIWILYFVLLLMSVWLKARSAPFVTAWLITLAILVGSIISGAIRQVPTDLPGRVVFILMLAIVSLLVWEIRKNYEFLESEVAERRKTQKKLEELTHSLEDRVSERTRELAETNIKLTEDITKRHKVEVSLATANQKLSLLSQITRHDILNQLMVLDGYLEISHDFIDKPETLKEFIQKEKQIVNTIEEQITFTRDYEELGIAAPEWQNVHASIKKAVVELPMREVKVEIDPKDLEIFADRLFEKVFYNLIDNALRYGGDGMKTIRFSMQERDGNEVIVCKDDGVGVPVDEKERIFDRGFGKNTGLGLALAREILSITEITIRENGEPGRGASFEITVPKGKWRIAGVNT
ncbi:MAG: HAMP domain-containing sensor histidine kinase [Methanoregula sp.]|nr:HAMP domain-containing sensor histidine kinase [Methanoregula sp.]